MSILPRGSSGAAAYQAAVSVVLPGGTIREAVDAFVCAAEALGIERPSEAELFDFCRQVADFTATLFPGEIAVAIKNDPEASDDLYFVFRVAVNGNLDDLMARSREWHLATRETARRWSDLFCLSFDVR